MGTFRRAIRRDHSGTSSGLTTFDETQEALALLRHHDIKAFISPPDPEPADYTYPGDKFFIKLEKTRLLTLQDVMVFVSLQDDGATTTGQQRSARPRKAT